jgi:bifunctional enzyme Fae/Hps
MYPKFTSRLSKKKRYLQIALNATLPDASRIIDILPPSERIIIEAGTPLIKRYGVYGIEQIRRLWERRIAGSKDEQGDALFPYIIADMKTMDRGGDEVKIAVSGGAGAVIALGSAPIETLNAFIQECYANGVDPMIDMMNVEFPLSVLRALKRPPSVVILHRGVDEERDNRQKMLPLHEIRRIKGQSEAMIAVAGGDTPREVQSASFNDADIVVVWKSVYQQSKETLDIVEGFLKTIK